MRKFFNKFKYKYFFWTLFYLFVLVIILENSYKILDPDFGWHLKVGQEIALNRIVPHINTFNYTYTGNWVDHEWLSDYLVYQIYTRMGYFALNLVFAILIIMTLIILFLHSRRNLPFGISDYWFAALQLAGLFACLYCFGIKIQVLSIFFLLLVLIIIQHYRLNKNYYYLIWLIPIFYLWANLHASFLIGLCVLFIFAGYKLAEKIIKIKNPITWLDLSKNSSYKEIVIFILFAFMALISTFFTPYKNELYIFLITYSHTYYLNNIEEWLPPYVLPINNDQLVYLSAAMLIIVLYFYFAIKKKYFKVDGWRVILVLFFMYLGFVARRNFPLFFISSFYFITLALTPLLIKKINFKSGIIKYVLKIGLLIYLLILIYNQASAINRFKDPFKFYSLNYPYDAVRYLKSNQQYANATLFNDYSWGGYLIWTYPEKKLFIDGRIPQVKYAGHTLIEEYMDFFKSESEIVKKLAQYNIKSILLSKTTPRILKDYLKKDQNWKLVYTDMTASVYYKKN